MLSESTAKNFVRFSQVAWMPRVLKTIHISVRCVSISASTSGQSKLLELLANAAAPTVSQAMAIPVAILSKGIREDLCQKCDYKDVWRLMGCSLSRQTKGFPRNTWLFVV